MRARTIITVVSAVLAVVGLAIAAAQAASSFNSSKSNVYRPAATPADQAACRSVGATIVQQGGAQVCVNPVLPTGWTQKQLPSCETCNRLCPGTCFMHVEGGCICYYDPLKVGG